MINDLQNPIDEQRTIDDFKKISREYIPPNKRSLWDKYVENYYASKANDGSMQKILNYIAQLSEHSQVSDIAEFFVRQANSYKSASDIAKVIAFFSYRGLSFYKDLANNNKTKQNNLIIDEAFIEKLDIINNSKDIEEGFVLSNIRVVKSNIEDFVPIEALIYKNGFIKGQTLSKEVVLGSQIENYYAFYIINNSGTYRRYLLKEPSKDDLTKEGETPIGFVTDHKGNLLSKINKNLHITYLNHVSLEVIQTLNNVDQNLANDSLLLTIMKELYELSLPINEETDIITIEAIMYQDSQKPYYLALENFDNN